MSLKTTKTQIVIIIILIALLGLSYVLGNGEKVLPDDDIKKDEIIVSGPDFIKVKHKFNNGVHEYKGEIELPTPCYILGTEAIVMESFPEQVILEFSYRKDKEADSCIQVTENKSFRILFQASEEAIVKAEINGRKVELVKVIEEIENEI